MEESRYVGGLHNTSSDSIKPGKNHFFAIGINKYESEKIPKLHNACRDITDLSKVLKDEYGFDDQVILLDGEATRSNFINKLNQLPAKIEPEDKLLIYYSGHGKVDDNDDTRGYWIPVDGELNDISSYVTNADVTDIIKSIDARHILLISDSCFSASLLQKFRSADEEGAYDKMEKNKSRWAFVSGKGVVSDGEEGENSPFTKSILKQLNKNEDKINISLLADQVIKQVSNLYDQEAVAIPLRTREHEEGGQFVFVKNQSEKQVWENILKQNEQPGYNYYLSKYPNGEFVNLAKKCLIDLEDEREWDEATRRNSQSSYLNYLDLHPKGKHVTEANDTLEAIRIKSNEKAQLQNSIREQQEKEKDLERKKQQELVFQKQKEKIENDLKNAKTEVTKSNTQNEKKKSSPIKYVIIGLIVVGGPIAYFLTKDSSDNTSISKELMDTTVSNIVIHEEPFNFKGKLPTDSTLPPSSVAGISIKNTKDNQIVHTDNEGNFVLSGVMQGDTLEILSSEFYLPGYIVVNRDAEFVQIKFQTKPPRITTNKTITGTVSGSITHGVYIYLKRNNKIILNPNTNRGKNKYGTKSKSDGTYFMEGVNEGDVIWFDTGARKKYIKVTQEIIYDFDGNTIVAR